MAIIDGRIYSKGQHLLIDGDSGKSTSKLFVVNVLPRRSSCTRAARTTCWVIPTSSAAAQDRTRAAGADVTRRDGRDRSRRPARHVPEAAQFALGGTGQEHDREPGRALRSLRVRDRSRSARAAQHHAQLAPATLRPTALTVRSDHSDSSPKTATLRYSILKLDRRSPMANVFGDTETQPLILELLSRRNWFKPKQLEEIEETAPQGRAGTLPEVALIRAGHISEQEIARPLRRGPVPAGDPQQRGSRRDRQGGRQPSAREALHRIG